MSGLTAIRSLATGSSMHHGSSKTTTGINSLSIRSDNGFLHAELNTTCDRDRNCWTCPDTGTCNIQALFERTALFDQARIPAVFLEATINNLESHNNTPSISRAGAWIIKWARTDPLPSPGLLLTGPTGAGKSFALAGLVRFLTLERGIPCLFIDFRHFLRQLKGCYDSTKQDSLLFETIRQVDVLVLDDVGAPSPTTWSRDVFETIISYRYNDMSRTFLTTNLALDVSSPQTVSPFAQWAGAHAFSRLRQMCYFLTFIGPDRRNIRPA
jgi:DNA replication protein DnaC